ncbi:peptidoglycan D,D-transpeptidase FtsI family protein [Deinococcus fonticola]|uniref:peptidoglycan D,D-transpeptidase FtsI family protein n=1 Tax=Deinococcus fonticola TaxID=2528713 RepID=UPI001F0DE4A6|nr:penicillin-binding transpeptidase domain-containing protein [Deinococcus fonticola]
MIDFEFPDEPQKKPTPPVEPETLEPEPSRVDTGTQTDLASSAPPPATSAAQRELKRTRVDAFGRETLGTTLPMTTEQQAQGRSILRGVALMLTLGLAALAGRLYQLQLHQHSQFAVRASSNFQRDDVITAVRGEIRTRDGVLLASSRRVTDLVYLGRRNPGDPAQAIADWDKIRFLAGVPQSVLVNGQPREPDRRSETSVVLARNVPQERLAALAEYLVTVPSLELRQRNERVYPQGRMAAHLIGYVQEASDRQVKEEGFTLGDLAGRSGLEYSLQPHLAGKNGLLRREVSASGKPLTEQVIDPGLKGQNVTLTIDSRLQRAAEDALQAGLADVNEGRRHYGKPRETLVRGAIIALDPRTGEVLAMASSPAYDPNWFAQVPSPNPGMRNWAVDPNRQNAALDAVTANRTLQAYNPGSVFKPASGLAYVEKWGNFSTSCVPSYVYQGMRFRNWARYSLGWVDARKAIAFSCNPWYYTSAVRASPGAYSRQLKERGTELGYRRPTGIELVGEKVGSIPSIDDYTSPKAPWYPGSGLNMSIGQGDVLVTPAQVARVLSTVINEGRQRPLTVVRAYNGQVQPLRPATSVVKNGNLSGFRLIKEGLTWTTLIPTGTARHELAPWLFPVRTGGKTGTAENGLSRRNGYAYTHAWYTGYGPLSNPNFLVVTFFQNGGEGSGPALKAAKRMFAARWCVDLSRPVKDQNPCTGELSDMHKRMDR